MELLRVRSPVNSVYFFSPPRSGGTSTLPLAMAASLKDKNINFNQTVTAIAENTSNGLLTVTAVTTNSSSSKDYAAVVSTVTLGCLSTIDLSTCEVMGQNYPQWSAIRELQYGPAIKIGIRWDKPWWQTELGIVGGQSFTDLPLRTMSVVLRLGPGRNLIDPCAQCLSLIPRRDPAEIWDPHCQVGVSRVSYLTRSYISPLDSYCWTQDAERLGALIGSNGQADERLIQMAIRDLAAVHGIDKSTIPDFDHTKDVFAWDWTHNPNTMGKFD